MQIINTQQICLVRKLYANYIYVANLPCMQTFATFYFSTTLQTTSRMRLYGNNSFTLYANNIRNIIFVCLQTRANLVNLMFATALRTNFHVRKRANSSRESLFGDLKFGFDSQRT